MNVPDRSRLIGMLVVFACLAGTAPAPGSARDEPGPGEPEVLDVTMIWDGAPHNAFTDLIRFDGRWFCTFREGQGHVSPDGRIRVLTATDADPTRWESAAVIEGGDIEDLRDPKLSVMPDGRLLLNSVIAVRGDGPTRHQSVVWTSEDGSTWSERTEVGPPDVWLWRVSWASDGHPYAIGYRTGDTRGIGLYRGTPDASAFEPLVEDLGIPGYPNEAALWFEDGDAWCLLRHESEAPKLGRSQAPFTDWTWTDLDRRIGGPELLRLPDGRLIGCVRLYDGQVRTALGEIDPDTGAFEEQVTLPSGGDTSYAGLVLHDGLLWVSYYASHEGQTRIYLARVRWP